MSYHYRKNKEQLYQQLNEVEKDIQSDHKNLQKLKLQAEFYEDKNKPIGQPIPHNQSSLLADQIMNQLIGNPSQQINKYSQKKGSQHSPHNYSYEAKTPTPKQELKGQAERQNNFINQRQLQKNKLQNQKHEGLFPTSSDRNKVRSFGKHPQPIPESDHYQNQPINKGKSPDEPSKYNPNFNPFVKDDEEEKRKKQDRNREYLKVLEEQRLEQHRKKEMQMKEEKTRKEGVYYGYMPSNKGQQKPLTIKKSDPNSKPLKIQLVGNHSQFDRNLIKSKAIQIKSKYKKGKIIYQEYQRQINNLKKQYGGDFQDLLEDKSSAKIEKQIQQQVEINQPLQIQEQLKRPTNNQSEQNGNESNNTTNSPHQIRNENANYPQIMPDFINQPQSYYQNSTLPANMGLSAPSPQLSPNVSAQYLDMMRKMFEVCIKQVKQAYQKNNQGQLYHDLMNKMITGSQNNFMPQQPLQASQQKQFFSDAKQQRQYFGKESHLKRSNPSGDTVANMPFGESDNSQYYDKSLSGIASKLPFNSIGPLKKEAKDIGLDYFYNNRYKIKKLHKFAILIDPNQSQLEIPATSTYLRPKNAKQQRDSRCQSDLIELRKLQSHNRIVELTNKMAKNSIYTVERRILKQPIINPVPSGSPQPKGYLKMQEFLEKNPFLKKHQDNLMTFNEHDQKINSPINKYSPKSKKEILEQDEYQTEPRQSENPKQQSNYYQEYEKKINLPATKMLDFVKANNEIINKKYAKVEDGMKSIAVKQSYQLKDSSKNYFSNNQISPVKISDNYYDQSLQTIKSDFELPNHSTMPVKALDVPKGIQQSQQVFESERLQLQHDIIGYSQTVESIEQSSQKRPSVPKRRSIGKKKQSSIIRNKVNTDSAIGRSGSMSQSGQQQEGLAKFDSNVYESQYEESVNYTRQANINPQIVKNYPKQPGEQTHIQTTPTFITVPMSGVNASQTSPEDEPKAKSHKVVAQNKWKSLQEARKLAKQCRVKTIEESKDYRSVEQKFSQLESFITKKDQSILIVKKQINLSQEKEKSPAKTKKNIIKLLEELQGNDEEEYRQDFQSYRQESEQYR